MTSLRAIEVFGLRRCVLSALIPVASLAMVALLAGCDGPSSPRNADASCPAVLNNAHQLLLVNSKTFASPDAVMRRYVRTRSGEDWQLVGGAQSVVVGRNGMGWGLTYRDRSRAGEPIKQEGDGKSPAGFFALGATFGFSPDDRPGHLHLKRDQHVCVDEPASEHYSRIVPRQLAGEGVSGEHMRDIALYRRGLVVDYPTSGEARSGSCIFIHVWKEPAYPTAGCVALEEDEVARLQSWVDPAAGRAVIGMLPHAGLARFSGCLPGVGGVADGS